MHPLQTQVSVLYQKLYLNVTIKKNEKQPKMIIFYLNSKKNFKGIIKQTKNT